MMFCECDRNLRIKLDGIPVDSEHEMQMYLYRKVLRVPCAVDLWEVNLSVDALTALYGGYDNGSLPDILNAMFQLAGVPEDLRLLKHVHKLTLRCCCQRGHWSICTARLCLLFLAAYWCRHAWMSCVTCSRVMSHMNKLSRQIHRYSGRIEQTMMFLSGNENDNSTGFY